MKQQVDKYKNKIKKSHRTAQKYLARGEQFAIQRPILTVGLMIIGLFILIAANSYIRQPEELVEPEKQVKQVEVFSIGEAPRIEVLAEVEKTGVVTIVAQAPGIVSNIAVEPGQQVGRGTNVISLASNYYGGNTLSLQRQLAKTQLDYVEDTYDLDKEVVGKQRSIAELSETNDEELREISEKSIDETKDLISLNEQIIDTFDDTINTSTVSAEIEAAKQAKSQYASGLLQLRQSLRNTEYSSDDDNPPADLSRTQRDLTLKQLEIQDKAIDLNKEITKLQYKIARVNEAQMYPATPFAGEIERVHVRQGQYVNPGEPLVTMYCDVLATQLVAKVPRDIAVQVSMFEPSLVILNNQQLELYPDFVSSVATDNGLYTIQFTLPLETAALVTDQSRVLLDLPVGSVDASATIPFVPIDAVHQSELVSEIYVLAGDQVEARQVDLGLVQGGFVEVLSGINEGDQIILDRTVIKGQTVEPISSL